MQVVQFSSVLGRQAYRCAFSINFGCLDVPQAANLLRLCEESARYLFLTKPCVAITEMAKGVPAKHHTFWNGKSVECFYRLFTALGVSSAKVIESIVEPLMLCSSEQRVFRYLTQLVGC